MIRFAAALAGLLGGACWIVAYAVELDALTWVGLVLVGVATLVAGAGLVSRSAPWLTVLVAVCFTALAGSVLAVLHDAGSDRAVDAAVGAGVIVVAVVALLRARTPAATAVRHSSGSHAR